MKENRKLKKIKTANIIFHGSLQLIMIPIASGLLTSGLLNAGLIKKFNLNKSAFLNFPIVEFQNRTSSTFSGLILAAVLGAFMGFIFYLLLKYVTEFILPNFLTHYDNKKVPSVSGFLRFLISFLTFPVIIALAAVSTRDLAKYGFIPKIIIDTEQEIFEVNSQSIAIIAALSCMLMFLYEMILKTFLRIFLKS